MGDDSWYLLLNDGEPAARESDGLLAFWPASSVPLAFCDPAGRLVRWTDALADILGETRLRAGDAFTDVLAAAGIPDAGARLRAAADAPQALSVRCGGMARPVRLWSYPTTRGGGIFVLLLLTATDDHDSRQIEFHSLVSHELRSPLAVIQGYAGLLATGQPGPLNQMQREFLGGIEAKVAELARRLEDFLDLQRLDSGTLSLRREAVSMAELGAQVFADHRLTAEARHVQLGLRVRPDDLTVHADPLRLRQILDSVVERAIKANAVGGWVRLEAVRTASADVVTVADGGPAIAAGDEGRLFEPGNQRDAPGRAADSGLGLMVSRRLVELHGGTIAVRGEPGTGTSIVVRLPRPGVPDDRRDDPA